MQIHQYKQIYPSKLVSISSLASCAAFNFLSGGVSVVVEAREGPGGVEVKLEITEGGGARGV